MSKKLNTFVLNQSQNITMIFKGRHRKREDPGTHFVMKKDDEVIAIVIRIRRF